MLRFILPALLAACAQPAAAQHCEISSILSSATADIKDTVATRITTEYGPDRGTFILDPVARKAGYAMQDGFVGGLYLYRIGASQPGKDWREPGSIATYDAGFAVEWPRILLNGKTMSSLGVELRFDRISVRDSIGIWGDRTRDGAIMRFSDSLPIPRHFEDMEFGEDEFDYAELQSKWAAEFPQNNSVSVTLYDPKTNQNIASALIRYNGFEGRQKQLVEDVTALRAAFAAGKCK